MSLKAVIIDDDLQQQDVLAKKIHNCCPQLLLVGMADGVPAGVELIKVQNPDIVFLDVEMPPYDGFELLDSLAQINFEVIFATSFTKYAYRAIKVAAADFLHKPFSDVELIAAVKRVEERIEQKKPSPVHQLLTNIHSNTLDTVKIGLPVQTGFMYVFIKDIMHIDADGDYTRFYFADKSTELVSKKMMDVEEILNEYNFFRTHHSHIVNLRYIKQYIRGEGGQAKLTDGTIINISKKNKASFLLAMKSI